jgi:putative oxidoreductase
MFHAPASFYPALNGGDAAILFTFVFLLFVFTGPGAWSLDTLKRETTDGKIDGSGRRSALV